MLETRKPPASPRIRPADASRRSPDSRRPAAVRSAGNAALRRELDIPPRPTPVARPNRLGRSEMRLMGLATVCTAVVCGLLLLYLAAYAHVTRLGIDQANARAQLRQSRLENEMLQEERDRLQSPQRVIAAATAMGMTTRGSTPVEYLSASSLTAAQGSRLANLNGLAEQQAADQETHGGTTEDSRTAASFHY